MFTGIIEEIGEISAIEKMANGLRMRVSAGKVLSDLKTDDSIAIDGVCQTVIKRDSGSFWVEAVGETLLKTTFRDYRPGRPVNLERALTLQTRLGGHLVQGHVNGTAAIRQLHPRGENYYLELLLPAELSRHCIPEGSIAVDGISLTIAAIQNSKIGINIIPHTIRSTTLQYRNSGDRVNIETDVIARIIEKLVTSAPSGGLDMNKLKNWGY